MVKIVNVVASGSLDVEFDLEQVATDMGSVAEYSPKKYPVIYIRFKDDTPLITLYRTGKYIITGSESKQQSRNFREEFLNFLSNNQMITTPKDEWFCIQNLVCTGELDQSLNLNTLTVDLGLEVTEYEPEQFPGLIYRPSGFTSVVLIFASGRVVITGIQDFDIAQEIFISVRNKISEITNTE
jgi:transcription initiation factor TFIID TATA-box-binding protein